MKKENDVIDADSYPNVEISGQKSAVKVSVFNQNKVIDCDVVQMAEEIRLGRMCA